MKCQDSNTNDDDDDDDDGGGGGGGGGGAVADPDHLVTGGDSFPARFRGGVVDEVP